jgi:molybdopterin synthase catalytic subunit/molybdopterin converting factor small subunit
VRIHLLAFASAVDALGASALELELPEGCAVGALIARLGTDFPRLAPLWPRLAIAVDGRIAGRDALLYDGAEVALLPPVSGGAPGTPPAVELRDGPLDLAALCSSVAGPGRGAVVLFVGSVRDEHAGRAVTKLTYSAYRPMALQLMARIVAELEASLPDLRVAISHRLGEVLPGEPSVGIAVAAPHRAAAYEASRLALERLKKEIPIWKREQYTSGTATWREEEPLHGGG